MHKTGGSLPGRNAEAACGSRRGSEQHGHSPEHSEPWTEAQAQARGMRASGGHPSLMVGTSPSFCMNSLIDTPKHSRGGRKNSHPHSKGEEVEAQ